MYDGPNAEGTSADGAVSPLGAFVARFAPRLSERAFEPGLVSAFDHHAAAVRDAVGGLPGLRATLTDYVLGFTDALRQMGWDEPVGHDFASMRLTAVCWLIREHGLDAA